MNDAFEVVPIDSVDPAPYNPRKMKPQQFEKLKASLRDLGFTQPIVCNHRDGSRVIVGGHQRVRAARELGFTQVPVMWVEYDDATERIANIAFNNAEMVGEWDFPKLVAVLTDIEQMKGQVTASGFDEHQIERMKRKVEAMVNKVSPVYPLASKLMEHYDYVVIFTENETDFIHLRQILGITTVRSYKKKKKGIGRVVRFADFIKVWEERHGGTAGADVDGVGDGARAGELDVEDGRDDVREDQAADEDGS